MLVKKTHKYDGQPVGTMAQHCSITYVVVESAMVVEMEII